MNRDGFTLIEVTVAIALLSIVMGGIFLLAGSLGDATGAQEAKLTTQDQARNAMMLIVRDLRQASAASINWNELPGPSVRYRTPVDLSGNGVPVDSGGSLELSPPRIIGRDTDDANNDGVTERQLVLTQDGVFVRVLANQLLDDRDVNGDGQLERGVWFEPVGQAVRVTIAAEMRAAPNAPPIISRLTETVFPRN